MLPSKSQVRNGVILLSLGLTLSACPPKPSPPYPPSEDSTPPEFLNVDIKLEKREGQPSPDTEGISILTQDVQRKLSRLYRIRIIATAGDKESWITNLSLVTTEANDGHGDLKQHNFSWRCASKPGELVYLLQVDPMTTTPPIAQSGLAEFSRIDVTVDPVGQAGCETAFLEGFIRVVATNGAGRTAVSKTFVFDFLP
ncbi:hypothetical protein COCOR_02870 [Corallococcus coralloides DSM 2259]|uniref:Lipoprotein n=1 Tax=Corallococcus coralloides (strain ATCC 25202 / DSM 2259 / NBRC 100086 / M2) TaxID=1144275 RepID=H8MYL1_CORCM|nr:hypothetical protein [Corallococcus coralloides]AFE04886.1 hypothetical protein COCOR_02870 [Corallococcus coralloides DSM 2259]